MKKPTFVIAIALFLGACTSNPSAPSPFAQADVNHDGYVSLDEWRAMGGLELAFLAADQTHRGKLNESEFNDARRLNAGAQSDAQSAQKISDAQITAAVQQALAARRDINAWAIRVETYQGAVQLSGTVRSLAEKQAAESVARSAAGTQQVFNNITLQN